MVFLNCKNSTFGNETFALYNESKESLTAALTYYVNICQIFCIYVDSKAIFYIDKAVIVDDVA